MNSKFKKTFAIFILIIIITFSGCSNGEYKTFKDNFNKSYINVISKVDEKDSLTILKKMKSLEITNEIKEMKELIDNIKPKVPQNEEKDFKNINKKYEGLALLSKSGTDWDKMTFEDQQKVFDELGFIGYERKQLIEKK